MDIDVVKQQNISASGDVAGRDIDKSITIYNIQGSVTWYRTHFRKLQEEIETDSRFGGVIDDLKFYNTKTDGKKGLVGKLQDGGFCENEIGEAQRKKLKFAKKQERFKNYKTAQLITSKLFALIILKFDDHIRPMIERGEDKNHIYSAVCSCVVAPIVEKLNIEGAEDDYLNYDAQDVLGMVYYLTGMCHINWAIYS